jgi:hypothetical protein
MAQKTKVIMRHTYLVDNKEVTYPWGKNKLVHIKAEKNGTNLHVWWFETIEVTCP